MTHAFQTLSSTDPVFDFPEHVRRARHIVVKPNVGYPAKAPVIVRMTLLRTLVGQLLALRTDSRISIVEGVCTKAAASAVFDATRLSALASDRVTVFDAESLPARVYDNASPKPCRFASFVAPELLANADVCISVAPFKRTVLNGAPLISASIKNLYGLFPRAVYHARSPNARGKLHLPSVHKVLVDVFHTLGPYFGFGVIDLHEKYVCDDWHPDRGQAVPVGQVLAGENLVALDRYACAVADEAVCEYLQLLQP
jgi:uncharacterized protein (DUF362 family)